MPGGTYSSTYTNQPVESYPMLVLDYDDDPYSGGYNLSTIPLHSYGETLTSVDIKHLIFGSDYVFAGIGSPDTGTFGLCPRVFVDYNYPIPNEPIPVHLAYLAIRITYEIGSEPPVLRVHPRRDGRGQSSAKALWPPSKAAQDRRWLPHGGGYR